MPLGLSEYSTADATQWENEYITDYAIHSAILPQLCWNQGWMPGNGTVSFTVVQDDAEATTRDRNGYIVYGNTNQDEVTVALQEALGAEKITDFNAFKSSVDQRKIMYDRVQGALNRDLNNRVLTALDGTSSVYNSGSAVPFTKAHIKAVLKSFWQNTKGGEGSETYWVVSDAAWLQLTEIDQFVNGRYVDDLVLPNGRKPINWLNVTFIPFSGLSGAGSADCKTFLFHKKAVAFKSANTTRFLVGMNEEHRYYYCNAQDWCAAKQLLTYGVYEVHCDDTTAFS